MAGTVIANRLRWLINAQKWNSPQVNDALTSAPLAIPTCGDLSVELLITEDGTNLFDYTNVANLTLEISTRNYPLNSNVVVAQQILVESISTGCTVANFNNGSAQAIQFVIPNAQMQLLVSGQTNYILAIYAESTDIPVKRRALCVVIVSVVDADLPAANPALPITFKIGNKMSFLCSDGQTRDVNIVQTPNGKWTLQIGAGYNGFGQGTISIFCSDNLWRDLTVILVDGVWVIDIGQAGHN